MKFLLLALALSQPASASFHTKAEQQHRHRKIIQQEKAVEPSLAASSLAKVGAAVMERSIAQVHAFEKARNDATIFAKDGKPVITIKRSNPMTPLAKGGDVRRLEGWDQYVNQGKWVVGCNSFFYASAGCPTDVPE